jgi:hypothetical protein
MAGVATAPSVKATAATTAPTFKLDLFIFNLRNWLQSTTAVRGPYPNNKAAAAIVPRLRICNSADRELRQNLEIAYCAIVRWLLAPNDLRLSPASSATYKIRWTNIVSAVG